MARYVLNRLVASLLVLVTIMTLSFFLMRLAPGGPFDSDKRLHPAVERNLWKTYGMAEDIAASTGGVVAEVHVDRDVDVAEGAPLVTYEDGTVVTAQRSAEVLAITVAPGETVTADQPIGGWKTPVWKQYLTAMSNYFRLDFGVTYTSEGQRTVYESIAQTFPTSMQLGLWSMLFAILFGVPAGLLSGLKANTWVDYSTMSIAMIGVSMSSIVLGPILILVFAIQLGWLEYGGWGSMSVRVLPVVTLGSIYAAYFARLTRGGMLDVVRQDYIRTARAKGLPDRVVVFRHALKGAILPSVTFLGPGLAGIMTGSVVVERIFNIPGVSEYFISGALNRDYPLVMGVVVLYSCLLVLLNLVVDVLYTVLDPRVTYHA